MRDDPKDPTTSPEATKLEYERHPPRPRISLKQRLWIEFAAWIAGMIVVALLLEWGLWWWRR